MSSAYRSAAVNVAGVNLNAASSWRGDVEHLDVVPEVEDPAHSVDFALGRGDVAPVLLYPEATTKQVDDVA
jgi:hypothetical protein